MFAKSPGADMLVARFPNPEWCFVRLHATPFFLRLRLKYKSPMGRIAAPRGTEANQTAAGRGDVTQATTRGDDPWPYVARIDENRTARLHAKPSRDLNGGCQGIATRWPPFANQRRGPGRHRRPI
jgi:hypothetical protein